MTGPNAGGRGEKPGSASDGSSAPEQVSDADLRELLLDATLLVVLVLSFLGGLGVSGASPALPGISAEFGVSEARIGLVMTVFTLGAFLVLPFTGILMDLYGRRPVVLSLLFLYGIAGTGIVFAGGFGQVLLLRFVQGVGFVGTVPLSIALVGDLYAGVAGSSAQGLRSSATGLSRVVVPGVAGFLAGIGWQIPFALNALAFAAFALAYVSLPETGAVGAADESGAGGVDGLPRSVPDVVEAARTATAGFAVELRKPTMLVLLVGVFVLFLARMALTTFVPLFAVRSLGTNDFVAGVALSLTGIGRFVVSPFAGSVQARTSLRAAIAGAIGTIAAGIALVGLVESVPPLYLASLLFGTGDALFHPLVNNAVTGMADDAYRARVVSVMEMLKTGAITVSPVLFGAVLALVGFERMFLLAGALAVLPAAPILVVLER